jgi:hypothetical protein
MTDQVEASTAALMILDGALLTIQRGGMGKRPGVMKDQAASIAAAHMLRDGVRLFTLKANVGKRPEVMKGEATSMATRVIPGGAVLCIRIVVFGATVAM